MFILGEHVRWVNRHSWCWSLPPLWRLWMCMSVGLAKRNFTTYIQLWWAMYTYLFMYIYVITITMIKQLGLSHSVQHAPCPRYPFPLMPAHFLDWSIKDQKNAPWWPRYCPNPSKPCPMQTMRWVAWWSFANGGGGVKGMGAPNVQLHGVSDSFIACFYWVGRMKWITRCFYIILLYCHVVC